MYIDPAAGSGGGGGPRLPGKAPGAGADPAPIPSKAGHHRALHHKRITELR